MIGYETNPQPRECNYSDKLEYYSREIASRIAEDGFVNISVEGHYIRLTTEDFELHVEEQGLHNEVQFNRDKIFNNWCESYAPYRIAYIEE